MVPTIHCNVDPEIVLIGRTRIPLLANYDELNHHHHDRKTQGENQDDYEKGSFPYISFSFRSSDALDEECFKLFAENLPWELFRMKGPVRFRDRTVFVNYVGGNNEWSVWDDFEETCLVFVGWKVGERRPSGTSKTALSRTPAVLRVLRIWREMINIRPHNLL